MILAHSFVLLTCSKHLTYIVFMLSGLQEQDALFRHIIFEKARTFRKYTRSYMLYLGMKSWKKSSVQILFWWFFTKKCATVWPSSWYDELMRLISRSLSFQIVIAQHVRLQRNSTHRNEIDPFLKWLITGHDIVYNNVNRKRSWFMEDEPRRNQKLRFI